MENPININISNSGENDENSYNEFKDYIIANNKNLHIEIKELRNQVKDLENDLLNKENESDKMENNIRYLKGLLQNLNELRKDYNNIKNIIVEDNFNISKDYNILLNIIKDICCQGFIINLLILHSIIFTNYEIYIYHIKNITSLIVILLIVYYMNINIDKYYNIKNNLNKNHNKIIEDIKKKETDIKKTEEACLSLENWICEF